MFIQSNDHTYTALLSLLVTHAASPNLLFIYLFLLVDYTHPLDFEPTT
jgi:hypothetical protein